jgi:hypothetical protein
MLRIENNKHLIFVSIIETDELFKIRLDVQKGNFIGIYESDYQSIISNNNIHVTQMLNYIHNFYINNNEIIQINEIDDTYSLLYDINNFIIPEQENNSIRFKLEIKCYSYSSLNKINELYNKLLKDTFKISQTKKDEIYKHIKNIIDTI